MVQTNRQTFCYFMIRIVILFSCLDFEESFPPSVKVRKKKKKVRGVKAERKNEYKCEYCDYVSKTKGRQRY